MNHFNILDFAVLAMLAVAGAMGETLSQDIFDNRELFYMVLFGAVGGGYAGTVILSKAEATRRQIASKFFTSAIVAVLFTPWLLSVCNVGMTRGKILGFSAVVAILGVAVIKGVAVAWTNFFIKRFSPPDGDLMGTKFQPLTDSSIRRPFPVEQKPPNTESNRP